MTSGNLLHEITHQWSSYTDFSLGLSGSGRHYSHFAGVPSALGARELVDLGDGNYSISCPAELDQAAELDKYMAGFIAAEELNPINLVLSSDGSIWSRCTEVTNRLAEPVTIEDIQEAHGVREPGHLLSRKEFNIGFAVETHNRLLTNTEFTYFSILANHATHDFVDKPPTHMIAAKNWASIDKFFGVNSSWSSDAFPETIFIDGFDSY